MLIKILAAIATIVAAFLVYVAFLPQVGTITRSAVITATPEAIYPHINSLKKWNDWSPWAKLDPAAKNSFDGPDEGPGAAFTWDGNNEVGSGKMTVLESDPNSRVKIKLEFLKPMPSTSVAEFTLKPEAGGTKVTWSMSGERPYLQRVMCVLFNVDKMVGEMFEKGLASLAAVAAKT